MLQHRIPFNIHAMFSIVTGQLRHQRSVVLCHLLLLQLLVEADTLLFRSRREGIHHLAAVLLRPFEARREIGALAILECSQCKHQCNLNV